MNIDAEVKMLVSGRKLNVGEQVFITIDTSAISDWPAATRKVEDGLWNEFGEDLRYGKDFEICNQGEIEKRI